MESVDVDASDAIRLILQFLKENQLFHAMKALQEETRVSFNVVDSVEAFTSDVENGKWDNVLMQTRTLDCSPQVMMDLYEHIVLEMIETQEVDVAKHILCQTEPMQHMKTTLPDRFRRLEKLTKQDGFDQANAYKNSSKEKRRAELAKMFKHEVSEVAPSRLLSLLGRALKWEQIQGCVASGSDFDLLRGAPKTTIRDETDNIVRKTAGKIKFSKNSIPQTIQFSRNGNMLTSGSKDGFIEVWDVDKCKLRNDLPYQAKEEFMMHDKGVTAQAYNQDGTLLATGSESGEVKVWKLDSGLCLRRFDRAHNQSIHSICFSMDGTQLLTGSFDGLIRIHGLKSGQTLKEFQGHSSFVNFATFTNKDSQVVSASCDGTVKVWDVKTTKCIQTIRPPNASEGSEIDIVKVIMVPKTASGSADRILLCTRANEMYLISLGGGAVCTYQTDANNHQIIGHFVDCVASPRWTWLYGITDAGYLLTFKLEDASLQSTVQVCKGSSLGIVHHPQRNIVATFGSDGYVRMWKA